MTAPHHIAVIDIGKTNAKLALVDAETLRELRVVTRPNTVLPGPPYPHFDVEGHWDFLLAALADFHRAHGVDAISVTTHGASAVLLDADGNLAAPVLDYEHDGPGELAKEYDALRPCFEETGSPRLAGGLNLGAQLHWQFLRDPTLNHRCAHILTYPQYWGHRLTGQMASDVSSIGCHTDLWNPRTRDFSSLVDRMGLRERIAPVRQSADRLGPILPGIAEATGLAPFAPVVCGIHDSNASLLPHLLTRKAPFSVVSTGTWVVVMAVAATRMALDPRRDTLVNVNAFGDPVASARFMGGREFDLISAGQTSYSDADIEEVLQSRLVLTPAVEPKTGPYRGRRMRWDPREPVAASGARMVALSFYLALVTAECLSITGARGPTVVEGPFSRNRAYVAMLASASGREVFASDTDTGTSIGAAMLFMISDKMSEMPPSGESVTLPDPKFSAYADHWQKVVGRQVL